MTLAAPEGSTVRVIAEGPDAAEAMHALEQLMQSQPGENRISTLANKYGRSQTHTTEAIVKEREQTYERTIC
jgi:hypothetical protein